MTETMWGVLFKPGVDPSKFTAPLTELITSFIEGAEMEPHQLRALNHFQETGFLTFVIRVAILKDTGFA